MLPRLKRAALILLAACGVAQADTYIRADGARIDAKVLDAPGCAPLAIISHGLGGSLSGNAPLASALNRAGYRVVVPSHAESGPKLLRQALLGGRPRVGVAAAATNPAALRARFADLDAILSVENRRCAVPFRVLAGHSMGASTTLIEAGAISSAGITGQNRFDAYIALSPQGEGDQFFRTGAFGGIRKPTLMITGTEDRGIYGSYETRLTAFEGLPPGRKRLAVIDGASHRDLGGNGRDVSAMVSIIAVEFLRQIRPGPWGEAGRRAGVLFAEK
jgi:pimeloyl-ACP methyl ester carboxylesterase